MATHALNLVIAQLNFVVGDIDQNKDMIIESIGRAENEYRADIIIFPELSLCAYPPEDLLLRHAFHDYIEQALLDIASHTHNLYALVGHPFKKNNALYNACSLIYDRKIQQTYCKQHLPNYGVFDEKRYFSKGHALGLFNINGIKAAMTICEDIWAPETATEAAQSGAKLLFNLNASPYHQNKPDIRERMLKQRAEASAVSIVYVNLVGGQDELVFDGHSMIVNQNAEIIFRAPQFKAGLFYKKMVLGRTQRIQTDIRYDNKEAIYRALVLGTRDYIRKNQFKGAVIGLSGGIDSAVTTCIAVDAIGAENVEVLLMPSRYTAEISTEDAIGLASTLGIKYHLISIEKPFKALLDVLAPQFHNLPVDATEENIQSRCRGLLLMAISNKTGRLVLTTGNKSEMAVGYATLYGDMAGGFAPLKDIWKTTVYQLAKWRNKNQAVIPARIIQRPPTAELRANQLDQDALPEYETLDFILKAYIEENKHPKSIISQGVAADMVYPVVHLVDNNEYKRRQSAPGIKITEKAFGKDRRYPMTSGYIET